MPMHARSIRSGLISGIRMVVSIWRHPGNQRGRMLGLARFLGWQFVKHVLKRSVVIEFHTKRLRCYPDSTSTSAALYFSGYPDYWEMKFLKAFLKPGDNFLDIGANTGVYSILASACIGPYGCIDAFEPVERTAARIEEQAQLNGLTRLLVHRFAVSDHNGELEFGYSSSDAMMHVRRPGEAAQGALRVKSVTLDTFAAYKDYAVGKMDIEGAEPLAFSGAVERLRQCNPPVWLLELAGYSTAYGVSSDEVVRRLAEAGFECAIFDPESGILEYTNEPWKRGVQNVLAISSRRKAEVEHRLGLRPLEPA